MAVAAELSVVYTLTDDISEVAEARQQVRAHAHEVLESRRSARLAGEVAINDLPVDALSTADKVWDAERRYGFGSDEYEELRTGLVLDCQRLVAEWYRKKASEYFAPSRHTYDPTTQDFFSHGLSIRQMTENALIPMANRPEEEARRVNEHVEDATPRIIRSLGSLALGGQTIRTISECTDWAVTEYAADMTQGRAHAGYGGYVPEIEKVMIRDIRLDPETGDRFEEQLGTSGTYWTHDVILDALSLREANVAGMTKTELHGAQILASDSLLDFARHLDSVASEQWCTEVFMGEEVERGTVKDYQAFRDEALNRQAGLTDIAEVTASFVLDLSNNGTDRRKALGMVEDFVKLQLLQLTKQDKAAAEIVFDKETAIGLVQVAQLEALGKYDEAFERMRAIEQKAPGGGFCGAGSCGLESVNTKDDAGAQLLKDLKAEPGDTVLKDKERTCRCGNKSIVYAYNKRKVNKFCESCGAFESKRT